MNGTLEARLDDLLTKGAKFEALMNWLNSLDFEGTDTAEDLRNYILKVLA